MASTIIFCCAWGKEKNGTAKEADLSELVTMVGEYYCVDSIGQAKHVLVIKNNSSKTVAVDVNVTVNDASNFES